MITLTRFGMVDGPITMFPHLNTSLHYSVDWRIGDDCRSSTALTIHSQQTCLIVLIACYVETGRQRLDHAINTCCQWHNLPVLFLGNLNSKFDRVRVLEGGEMEFIPMGVL